jgi:hypothetical protein
VTAALVPSIAPLGIYRRDAVVFGLDPRTQSAVETGMPYRDVLASIAIEGRREPICEKETIGET